MSAPPAPALALPVLSVALGAFVLFAATACPTVPFGDGGELIAAAHRVGVAHPPGYPLYVLLGKVALSVPAGEPAFRMNLLSSLFGGVSCGLAGLLAGRWSGSRLAVLAAGGALAVSSTFWSVATVAEVYTLHVALILALLVAADIGAVLLGGLVLGLGLAHHPTIVLVLPAAAVVVWRARPPVARWAAAAGLTVLVAGALDLFMLLRARSHPEVVWGQWSDVGSWIDHLTASGYRAYDLGWSGERLVAAIAWLARDGAGIVLVLAGVAMLRAAGRRGQRIRTALVLVVALSLAFASRYATEDAAVYLLPAVAALSIAAGLGVARVAELARMGAVVAVVLLIGLPIALHGSSRNLRGMTAAADYGRDVLAGVPRQGVLFTQGDDGFILDYLLHVRGERRDVTVYDREGFLFRDLLRERGTPRPAGEGRLAEQAAAEQAHATLLPGVCFLSWPGYDLAAGWRFEPAGLVYRVVPPGAPPPDLPPPAHEASVREDAMRLDDPFALTVAATYPLMRGEHLLARGRIAEAQAAFEQAVRLSRGSETIHNTLGTIWGRRGDFPRAIEHFEAALRAKPASPRARANLEMARRLAGQP